MRPASNAMELIIISEKCNGLLIREDHPGLMQLGQAALFPSYETFPEWVVLSPPAGRFIRCVAICVNGRQLHAVVDLSRQLGYSC
jgi:hypothetical protein